ncbi:MAG: glycoside hydrolase family 13 protein [Clostridia bacterium]|nr:glycoside hydrolase family 13 protein [Clostridia bacterium]
MEILFNSRNIEYKKPFGCLKRGENCFLRIDIPSKCKTKKVKVCIFDEDGFEMRVPFNLYKTENDYEIYNCSFSLFKTGLYFYYFFIETTEGCFSLHKKGEHTNIAEGDFWQITCYNEYYDTPKDFKGRVMYQIFPDRFAISGECDLKDKLTPFVIHESTDQLPVYTPNSQGKYLNNDFFGGNLNGIASKIPYLKELGIGVIYLNPIFMAFSNHRYDTADYKRVDPMLGTEKDFKELCKKAHQNNIKIILDGVFSHTGSNSIYFDKENIFGTGAVSQENSPYKNWFMFESYPDKYTSWWGIDTLPCVDELNPDYMNYIIYDDDSVIKHWLRLGADGFRLDVVDELPDEFVLALKNEMKDFKPDALLIGEVWEDASNKISYSKRRKYFTDSELDSVMNYPFRNAVIGFVSGGISGEEFKEQIMTIVENYPKEVLDCTMNMLSTHDTPRILSCLGVEQRPYNKEELAHYVIPNKEEAVFKVKLASLLQFTLPGMPCIYYGDEIGMEGFEDPLCRGFFKWKDKNEDLLEFFKKLTKLKNDNPSIKMGNINFLKIENALTYIREFNGEKIGIYVGESTKDFNNILLEVSYGNKSGVIYKIDE